MAVESERNPGIAALLRSSFRARLQACNPEEQAAEKKKELCCEQWEP